MSMLRSNVWHLRQRIENILRRVFFVQVRGANVSCESEAVPDISCCIYGISCPKHREGIVRAELMVAHAA